MNDREIDPSFDLGQLSNEERQRWIDHVRLKVITTRLVASVMRGVKKPDVCHLRFPRATLKSRTLRQWNPPADSERDEWERGMRLEIDVGEIPPSVARHIKDLHRERRRESLAAPNWSLEGVKKLVLDRERKSDRLWLPR